MVSVIGILDYEGAREQFKKVIEKSEFSRDIFYGRVKAEYNEDAVDILKKDSKWLDRSRL